MTPSRDGEEPQLVDHLLDLLGRWGPVEARRMFGGYGLFRGGAMFGLVSGETAYFKTDESNRRDYEALAMPPFRYRRSGRSVSLAFYALPPHLLEDDDELAVWAAAAWAVALRSPRRRPAARRQNELE